MQIQSEGEKGSQRMQICSTRAPVLSVFEHFWKRRSISIGSVHARPALNQPSCRRRSYIAAAVTKQKSPGEENNTKDQISIFDPLLATMSCRWTGP